MTLLLRYLLGLVGVGIGGKPVDDDGGETGLTLNKPYLVLRTGMKGGKQVALVMDGDCDGLTEGRPLTSLRTGKKGGKQVQLAADQKLDPDGKLIIGKPYLALRTGMKDGKQVVLVAGKECDACAVLSGERESPYPATLYVADVLFLSIIYPGVAFPFPITETFPGSRVWTGTAPDDGFGNPVTFTMDCLAVSRPGTLRSSATGFFTSLLDPAGRTPSSFDPFICRFYQTVIGGITWDVIE